MLNITFQQIGVFLTVARFLNLSRAAESLYISQPTLSKALQRFEKSLGFQVFTRSNQGVALTPQGEYLLTTLDLMYSNMERALRTAKELSAGSRSVLRIAAPSSFDAVEDYNPLKSYVRGYTKTYPDVELNILLSEFRELRRQIEWGEVDIAFTHGFLAREIPDIKCIRISSYTLYLAMSARHPLAVFDTLQPDKLSELTFYTVPLSNEENAMKRINMRCRENGFTPGRIECVDNFLTLLHALRQKRGASLCGKFNIITSEDLRYYPLKQDGPSDHLVVAWREDRLTKEARNFIDMLPKGEPQPKA